MNEGAKLLEETRELLLKRPANVPLSKVATDVGVSVQWLRNFAKGDDAASNPAILTVGRLKAYLKDLR